MDSNNPLYLTIKHFSELDLQFHLELVFEAPTDDEIEDFRQGYANGEFYRYVIINELRAGLKKVNKMIMNRKEFNEVFEVTVSEKR
ncbi:hypothetical protein [Lysinibacillus fusiformis]|uniref:hypothetical protein n=1 Tax=Lysinibacillus fusiformis TaxID=28031 RepID=UPI0020C0CDB7|nr:hypothetical protein [Lysinibacillus fusiformis]